MINIHTPTVLFVFVYYGLSGYAVTIILAQGQGQHTSVISTSTDEPDEQGLHH